jgi:hypothetical protein
MKPPETTMKTTQRFTTKDSEIHDFELPPPMPMGHGRPGYPISLPVALVVSAAILGASGVLITLIRARESRNATATSRAEPTAGTAIAQKAHAPITADQAERAPHPERAERVRREERLAEEPRRPADGYAGQLPPNPQDAAKRLFPQIDWESTRPGSGVPWWLIGGPPK